MLTIKASPGRRKRTVCVLFFLVLLGYPCYSQSSRDQKLFLVCGDSKVLLVDFEQSRDSIPAIVWTWDAHLAPDLPEEFRLKKFNSVDDCKSVSNGRQILVSSSSGAVAILERSSGKVVFYASVPNAHSVEILPDDLLVAAASTDKVGNRIMLFDIAHPGDALFTDSLYSAHGLVWDEKRKSLYALGYDVLREYKILSTKRLSLVNQWKIPGSGGHDLQSGPDGNNLFVTEHSAGWKFDREQHVFSKIENFPQAENIKSLGQNDSGQYIFTIPEESWWTYHVNFFNPKRKLTFQGMHVYKARWFIE